MFITHQMCSAFHTGSLMVKILPPLVVFCRVDKLLLRQRLLLEGASLLPVGGVAATVRAALVSSHGDAVIVVPAVLRPLHAAVAACLHGNCLRQGRGLALRQW